MYRAHKFNILEYLSKTYVKYVLPVLASIGLIYIFPLLGSGPLWHLFDETVARQCQKNILSNLLFYNNLNENIEEIVSDSLILEVLIQMVQCNLPTAFVSLIFQMKLVAPMLLLIISHFRPKTGAYILTTICLATISLNLIPRFYFNYLIPYEYKKMNSFSVSLVQFDRFTNQFGAIFSLQEIKQSIVFYNFNPVVHLSPFIFGMALGRWIIATIDQPKCQRHYQVAIAGITSFLLTTASMAFMEQLKITNPSLPAARVAVMLSVGKLVLISFFCWLVYACIMGHISECHTSTAHTNHTAFPQSSNREPFSLLNRISTHCTALIWLLPYQYPSLLFTNLLDPRANCTLRQSNGKCVFSIRKHSPQLCLAVQGHCVGCRNSLFSRLPDSLNDPTANQKSFPIRQTMAEKG